MKKLIYMKKGFGYLTSSGVKFTKEHPFQLVDEGEVNILLDNERFREGTPEELKKFYGVT